MTICCTWCRPAVGTALLALFPSPPSLSQPLVAIFPDLCNPPHLRDLGPADARVLRSEISARPTRACCEEQCARRPHYPTQHHPAPQPDPASQQRG